MPLAVRSVWLQRFWALVWRIAFLAIRSKNCHLRNWAAWNSSYGDFGDNRFETILRNNMMNTLLIVENWKACDGNVSVKSVSFVVEERWDTLNNAFAHLHVCGCLLFSSSSSRDTHTEMKRGNRFMFRINLIPLVIFDSLLLLPCFRYSAGEATKRNQLASSYGNAVAWNRRQSSAGTQLSLSRETTFVAELSDRTTLSTTGVSRIAHCHGVSVPPSVILVGEASRKRLRTGHRRRGASGSRPGT